MAGFGILAGKRYLILIFLAVQFLPISVLWSYKSSIHNNTALSSYGDNASFIYQHNVGGSFWWNERVNCITVSQLLLSNIPLHLPAHFQHFIQHWLTMIKWLDLHSGAVSTSWLDELSFSSVFISNMHCKWKMQSCTMWMENTKLYSTNDAVEVFFLVLSILSIVHCVR